MDKSIKCPSCGSTAVMFSQKRQLYICEDCSLEFKPEIAAEKRRVFISYGHDEHSDLAMTIAKDLEARGYLVWIDKDDIKGGVDWEIRIEKGLDWISENPEDSRFSILMTPYSVRRPDGFCLNELSVALSRRLRVVPIMVSMCEPPLSICRIQWLDMIDCVPLKEKYDNYQIKLDLLIETLEQKNVDYKGEQSRLLNMLEPISFDADIAQHVSHFVGRKKVLDNIESWLADRHASRMFFITGPPGVGKTALVSWLCNNRSDVAAFHLCRFGNQQRSDSRKFILSLAYQLSTQLPEYRKRLDSIGVNVDVKEMNARDLFDRIVVQPLSGNFPVPEHSKLIIVDALDEAVHGGKNEILDLLAEEFQKTPNWLRLIVTSRPDTGTMYSLQGITPYNLEPDDPDNYNDLREYLENELNSLNYGLDVSEEAVDIILKNSEGIFLYVERVLNDLKTGRLSLDHIQDFPRGLGGVYAQFFKRQFPDIDHYKAKIRPAMEIIVSAREPISLDFIIDNLKWDVYEQADIIKDLSTLFPVFDNEIRPFHKTLIEWLTDVSRAGPYFVSIEQGHKALASYGWGIYQKGERSWPKYLVKYLVEHLHASKRMRDIEALLGDMKFFRKAWEMDRYNMIRQWIYIENNSPVKMSAVYGPMFMSPGEYDVKDITIVCELLRITYHHKESTPLLDHLHSYYEKAGDMAGLQKTIGDQASVFIIWSDYEKAMSLLKRQEAICREIGKKDGIVSSLKSQADIKFWQGDYESAFRLWDEEAVICREIGDKERLAVSLNNQAFIQRYKGDLDASLKILKEQEKICRDIGNKQCLQECFVDQGFVLYLKGEFKTSIKLLKTQEKLCRELGDKRFLHNSLLNQMNTYVLTGDLEKAEKLLEEDETIIKDTDRSSLLEFLHMKGRILALKGELDRSMDTHREQERISREMGYKPLIQKSLGGQAVVYREKGELDKALALHREQERICRDIKYVYGLQECLGDQVIILIMKNDFGMALVLNEEQEEICKKMGYRYWLQQSLGRKAEILKKLGKDEDALRSLREQETLCAALGIKKGLVG